MGLKQVVKPLDEVFDESLDTAIAPSLGKVYGYVTGAFKPETQVEAVTLSLYGDPDRFFSATYITEGMRRVFEEILGALERGAGGLIVLPSLFGGGKTHVLLALYHAFRKPEALLKAEPRDVAGQLYERVGRVDGEGGVEVVVVDGDYASYAPTPSNPLKIGTYTVHSVWGYIAHCLGRYDDVRGGDERFEAPPVDRLEALFAGKRALILMDEILSGYALNLSGEQRRILLEFFRRLAMAVRGRRVAVIIAIPAYYHAERGAVEVEELYRDLEDLIRGFFEAVRDQATIIPPVKLGAETGGDVVRILRKRIFGKSDVVVPGDVLAYYQGIYGLELFPPVARHVEALKESYPFHPTYIDTLLRHVAEKKPKVFQRTRFAILVTRKAVRRLWRSQRDPDFIHVWSVDLEDEDISNAVLGKLLSEKDYRVYLSKLYQVAGKLFQEEKALAKDLITTVFLRTFLYEGVPEATKAHPTESEVYWAVYDRDYNVEPARLTAVLERLIEDPDASYIVREDSRVYFTTLIEITEIVGKRAEDALAREKSKLIERLKKELGELLTAKDEPHSPFSEDYALIRTGEELRLGLRPEDAPQHRVVVYLGALDRTEAENLITGYANYRNVVVVLDAPDNDKRRELLTATAWLYVIDRMTSEKELETMFAGDEFVKNVNELKLKDIRKKMVNTVMSLAPKTFNRVWYPAGDGVRNVTVLPPKKSLLGNVRTALESRGVEKILKPEEVDLQVFLGRLAEAGGRLDEWIQVSTVVDLFHRNPRLWIASKSGVLSVLKRLYENLDIMVMREGGIYWKNICEDDRSCHGGPHPAVKDLRDLDLVARAESKFGELLEKLLENEGLSQVQGGFVERLYYLQVGDSMFRLRDLLNTWGREKLYRAVKDPANRLILKTKFIERGFSIEVEPEYKEVRVGEDVEVKVRLSHVGEFRERVILRAEAGTVNPPDGIPPFEATWKLVAPGREGLYEFKLEAYSEGMRREAGLKLKVIGEYEVIEVEAPEYDPRPGDLIEEISGKSIALVLDAEKRLLSGLGTPLITLDASWGKGKLQIKSHDAELNEIRGIVESLTRIKGDVDVAEITLKLADAKPLDESSVKKINASKSFHGGVRLRVKRKVVG
jgi:predicted AAA+ superfamily ATPase